MHWKLSKTTRKDEVIKVLFKAYGDFHPLPLLAYVFTFPTINCEHGLFGSLKFVIVKLIHIYNFL